MKLKKNNIKIRIKEATWLHHSNVLSGTHIHFELTEMQFISYDIIGMVQKKEKVDIEIYDKIFTGCEITEYSYLRDRKLFEIQVHQVK
jgi:hypothetical protein